MTVSTFSFSHLLAYETGCSQTGFMSLSQPVPAYTACLDQTRKDKAAEMSLLLVNKYS